MPDRNSENGDFQSFLHPEDSDDSSDEEEFSWAEHVMPHIVVGEVLVVVCAGAEKLRYVSGWAQAYVRRANGTVDQTAISISDIYGKASEVFSVDLANITAAEY